MGTGQVDIHSPLVRFCSIVEAKFLAYLLNPRFDLLDVIGADHSRISRTIRYSSGILQP
jgi:hypothetical protein